jgi:hypothetical protein
MLLKILTPWLHFGEGGNQTAVKVLSPLRKEGTLRRG